MRKDSIFTMSQLAKEGIKIARLEGNRDLSEKAVKGKEKSMKGYGQLVPAIVVDASTGEVVNATLTSYSLDDTQNKLKMA